jgi:hypothetical protein
VLGVSVRSVELEEIIVSGSCVLVIFDDASRPATPDAWFLPLIMFLISSRAVFRLGLADAGLSDPASRLVVTMFESFVGQAMLFSLFCVFNHFAKSIPNFHPRI